MKEFQKRNKMSMQFLLLNNERKLVKRLQKMSNQINPREKDDDSITSEMYDEPNDLHGLEIEKEPEFENNISTSLFIKDLVERMNKKAENRLMGGGIFGQRANSTLDDPTGS